MYAVGHFALGYLTGKLTSKTLNVSLNLPLLFFASVFPDIDILVPFIEHRGPIHSVIFYCVLFVPFFILYKKMVIPYFVAVLQHLLIGDFLTGGARFLWPLSTGIYGLSLGIQSQLNVAIELSFFVVSLALMINSKDIFLLFKHNLTNLLATIPLTAVLLPTLISYPLSVPYALFIPHLTYFAIFGYSILLDLKFYYNKLKGKFTLK